MHPIIMHEMAKITINERLAAAEAQRMVKQARAGQPGLLFRLKARFAARSGDRSDKQLTEQARRSTASGAIG